MRQVVANCEDFCKTYNRVPYFYITGGDPILHPHFWKLMVLLKSKEIPFTIMGNPFHLNDEVCRMLKACGCEKYQVSLDGMRQTHDWFRKPGSFELTLEGRVPQSCRDNKYHNEYRVKNQYGRNTRNYR